MRIRTRMTGSPSTPTRRPAEASAMADPAYLRKLKVKPGQRLAAFRAPEGFAASLEPLPEGSTLALDPTGAEAAFDWAIAFVENSAALAELIGPVRRSIKPVSQLWLAYPKGSSKMQTDLTRDKGWEALGEHDLLWVNLISVDATWSAFGMRPLKPGEPRQDFR
jgi:hypothetical protein